MFALYVKNGAVLYKKEIVQLLEITLPRLAEGFNEERGALFGFGLIAEDDTGSLLKISSVDEVKRRKLNKVAVHDFNDERSVEKQCLESSNFEKKW